MKRSGRKLTDFEQKMYGDSKMLRYVAGTGEPIYPVGYVQTKKPMAIKSVHKLIHATKEKTIRKYCDLLDLNKKTDDKNKFAEKIGRLNPNRRKQIESS